jgi:GH15 family glucan-1,4-alpha-glucosidase
MALDHGAIGNGRVIALVGANTSIDWLCLPRFDSPSVFGRLIDAERGGSWRIDAVSGSVTGQSYIRNTNVLVTTLEGNGGSFDVVDFAPWVDRGSEVDAPMQIVRLLIPTAGHPQVRVHFDPAPDYARRRPEYVMRTRSVQIGGHACDLTLSSDIPIDFILNGVPVTLDRPRFLALCAEGNVDFSEQALHLRDRTIWAWLKWVKSCSVPDFRPDAVVRSALALKLHQYAPTGAIIAAATTSIPEEIGTERTWDYRYCWLRDAAIVVEALRRLGCINEGERFLLYLRDIANTGELQPVYGVGGQRHLEERILDHLSGYLGSGPVRIGNAASSQVQHDLMGELLLSVRALLGDPRTTMQVKSFWPLIERLVREADNALFQPDTSIWEIRSEPALHTFSQAMCWAALVSGAQIAAFAGRDVEAELWQRRADEVHPQILERAFNRSLGMFTEKLDGKFPDAAVLLLPTIGFVSARGDEFRSTLQRYEEQLVVRGLMKRYGHADDFGVPSSTFTLCSFWWAEALAISGELERAIEVFERLLDYANGHGLYSEDIDPRSGEMLGNFPQAYTHVGLVNAAVTIGLLKAARDERIAPWQY